jgi:deoxyribodipyrimidine photolyase-related protein
LKTLRLILGDQLNAQHPWFQKIEQDVMYVMMEVKSETGYVLHHAQKIIAIFAAMRAFHEKLCQAGHQCIYIKISDPENCQQIDQNLLRIIQQQNIEAFEYQLPDEIRLDKLLNDFCLNINIPSKAVDTAHFITTREQAATFFNQRAWLMESFYRHLRNKHQILMDAGKPIGNQWNFDKENRKAWKGEPVAPNDWRQQHNHTQLFNELQQQNIAWFGSPQHTRMPWPINTDEARQQLNYFLNHVLAFFGDFQDAMSQHHPRLFHSLISFALNVKMISPLEVVEKTEQQYRLGKIPLAAAEGFIRQILGWREYIRGYYWANAESLVSSNFFNHQQKIPEWFWNANTKMSCLHHCIQDSLQNAYAHHIQRLMVIGNFSLLAGLNPEALHRWYLGIYIDAFEWVEMPNTLGMSQFADGGKLATKPYVSSANYIDKMSDYCSSCHYNKKLKVGENACPFNSLYWDFFIRHADKLGKNPRLGIVYQQIKNMSDEDRQAIRIQSRKHLEELESL